MSSLASLIMNRRTIREFTEQPVTVEQIMNILEAAVWAPFHSSEEPWRFILFVDEGKKRFADAVLSTYSQEAIDKWGAVLMERYTKGTACHLIVVMDEEAGPVPADRQKQWEEAYGAASALIQNIQLLAWEQKIGAVWKTNAYNWDRRFCDAIGVLPDEKVVGTLHLGYYDEDNVPQGRERTPVAELMTIVRH